jgi:hypothetical protein
MTEQIEIASAPNPFLAGFDLPLRARFFPLGFPLDIETNSKEVLAAAAESWGLFPGKYHVPPVSLSMAVVEGTSDSLPPRPTFHARGHLMHLAADLENQAICDFRARCAYGWMTRTVAANSRYVRHHMIGSTAMMLLTQAHLAPVHGALLVRNGRGVMLCGESFAGKSTLAYALAKAGWTLVTDDATYLVRNESDRAAIGNPFTLRLREESKVLFPELAGYDETFLWSGKFGIELSTRDFSFSTAYGSSIEYVVFLNRKEGLTARLRSFSKEDAMAFFESHLNYGEIETREAQRREYRRLLGADLSRMDYSSLADAIECLERLVS